MQPFQPPPAGPSLAGWMANAAASSSVQSAVVAASSIPVPPNHGMDVQCYLCQNVTILALDIFTTQCLVCLTRTSVCIAFSVPCRL
jgi:hypothetical protein